MILVLTFVAASFTVQAPPDLSGTWTLDPNRSAGTGGGTGARDNEGGGRGGGLGLGPAAEQLTIRQDATAIVIEERRGTTTASLTYALHGGKTTNAVSAGRSSGDSAVYVTAWKGRRLVTSITMPDARGGPTVRYEEVRYLNGDGSLVVETTMRGRPNKRTTVYVRSK